MANDKNKNQQFKKQNSKVAKPGHKLMTFKENKFYDNHEVPCFEAGKVYNVPIEGGHVDRWLKRGGKIVETEAVVEDVKEEEIETPETPEQEDKK